MLTDISSLENDDDNCIGPLRSCWGCFVVATRVTTSAAASAARPDAVIKQKEWMIRRGAPADISHRPLERLFLIPAPHFSHSNVEEGCMFIHQSAASQRHHSIIA